MWFPKPSKVDETLTALNPIGTYQLLQIAVSSIGLLGSAFQVLGNVFIGGHEGWHQCATPDNSTILSSHLTHLDWNSSQVNYGQCQITVSRGNLSDDVDVFPCLFGHNYSFPREMSFRTEFDLVCDRKMLGGLAQTCVIMGQGIGAFFCSMVSDRFGRKKVMVSCHMALLILGVTVGFSPSFAVLAVLRFVVGVVQQGLSTSLACLTIEWLPAERRSLQPVFLSTCWGLSSACLVLPAYLFRHHDWRSLQWALSLIPLPILLFQCWFNDESFRWLVTNNRKKVAERILKRAARVNHKDLSTLLNIMETPLSETELTHMTESGTKNNDDVQERTSRQHADATSPAVITTEHIEPAKLTLLDLFKNRHLVINACIMWLAWFSCAFAYYALYMMTTSLHGNRFLNYFLTAIVEIIPGFIYYFLVDRIGRKWASRPLFLLAGIGSVGSGVCRIYTGNSALRTLSVVTSIVGMLGASGGFGALYFFTPELFPTNMRTQALGMCCLIGWLGGMLAPFMTDLADIAVWAPGALIGSLCFLVVISMHFLPETKGRQLPNSVEDVEQWYHKNTRNVEPLDKQPVEL